MSLRIRGQEATVRITVDGETQTGTWFKVKDFTETERGEIKEEEYLGELQTDLDYQHDGWDLAFSCDVLEKSVFEYIQKITSREEGALAHPVVTVTVIYSFRADNGNPVAVSYYDTFMRVTEVANGGRKEYVSATFEAKAKKKALLEL